MANARACLFSGLALATSASTAAITRLAADMRSASRAWISRGAGAVERFAHGNADGRTHFDGGDHWLYPM